MHYQRSALLTLALLTSLGNAMPYPRASNSTSSQSNGTTNSGSSDALSHLLPSDALEKWTTYPGAPGALPLSDDTLRPTHKGKETYEYTKAPDGHPAMKINFAKGSYRLLDSPRGGVSFTGKGPAEVDMTKAKELTFGYSLWADKDFDWNKGGKLPGFHGGDNEEVGNQCAGGNHNPKCFSSRLMWRKEGAGEVYSYLPKSDANSKLCDGATAKADGNICNDEYGNSLGRGKYTWKSGGWTRVMQRMKLNSSPDQADGEIELFVDGKSVIKVEGIIVTTSKEGHVTGLDVQSFFGGHDADWASPKDQDLYFADFSVAILKK